jgi:hypothetical protein
MDGDLRRALKEILNGLNPQDQMQSIHHDEILEGLYLIEAFLMVAVGDNNDDVELKVKIDNWKKNHTAEVGATAVVNKKRGAPSSSSSQKKESEKKPRK